MTIAYDQLNEAPRLLMEAELKPLQGHRFQPTGFADLGPARYTLPDGTEMLLVESVQSVANRMELACWDTATNDLIRGIKGLPYIRVNKERRAVKDIKDGEERGRPDQLTNSVLESHRINSEYIMKSGDDKLRMRFVDYIGLSKGAPVDWRKFQLALLTFDPLSLVHGCFLEEIDGRLRATRLLSGFVEANDIRVAESGGAKLSHVDPKIKGGGGNVIFHRTEFTAREIKAYFNIDLALLRGYGLPDAATKFLIVLSLFKVRRFLSTGLRLRTACDLDVDGDLTVKRPKGFAIPDEPLLLAECTRLIDDCEKAGLFAKPAITEVEWKPSKKKRAKGKADEESAEAGDDDTDEAEDDTP